MLSLEGKEVFMPDFAKVLGANKSASSLLVLFIPSKDRSDEAIDQHYWVKEALSTLGTLFGGATDFPAAKVYGETMPKAASFYSMSLSLFSATRATNLWNDRQRLCWIF